jgi:hypothetical protein
MSAGLRDPEGDASEQAVEPEFEALVFGLVQPGCRATAAAPYTRKLPPISSNARKEQSALEA